MIKCKNIEGKKLVLKSRVESNRFQQVSSFSDLNLYVFAATCRIPYIKGSIMVRVIISLYKQIFHEALRHSACFVNLNACFVNRNIFRNIAITIGISGYCPLSTNPLVTLALSYSTGIIDRHHILVCPSIS